MKKKQLKLSKYAKVTTGDTGRRCDVHPMDFRKEIITCPGRNCYTCIAGYWRHLEIPIGKFDELELK